MLVVCGPPNNEYAGQYNTPGHPYKRSAKRGQRPAVISLLPHVVLYIPSERVGYTYPHITALVSRLWGSESPGQAQFLYHISTTELPKQQEKPGNKKDVNH